MPIRKISGNLSYLPRIYIYIYPTDVKSVRFQCQLEAFRVSNHTEELWYNKTVNLWMNVYIYIYVCVCVCVCVYKHVCVYIYIYIYIYLYLWKYFLHGLERVYLGFTKLLFRVALASVILKSSPILHYRRPKCSIRLKSFALFEWQPLIPSPKYSTHNKCTHIYKLI